MSLPPGFLDELRNRLSLAQVVGRKVMWDPRKSNQGRGDMWAPCPFHQEKTASFHVDDRKGFYYCFGCHAKGDALNFVQETENVGFMEAVEILAREAGMPMPARDPQAQAKADRRTQLADVMEQAVRHYRMQLGTGAAAAARAYLERRGLKPETLERFEIGFAPDARRGVLDALTGRGNAEADVIEAGLAARPDTGPAYDRFRGRIMFPIRDARGRCIGFGGRAMDPNARAKYYNSPETPLFDKGRSLFNHSPAREAAGKGAPLIIAEGYMDVIALWQAGFASAVAPLGTAITADQLELMWRISPEPVIALDGDTAGLRAGQRLIDLALPLLGSGRSLRFALLPGGQDPDDLIKAHGAAAMQGVLDAACPLIDLLWRRETEGQSFDSPERRAALEHRLREATAKITDQTLRQHYERSIRDLLWQHFRAARPAQGPRKGNRPAPGGPRHTTRNSGLMAGDEAVPERLREAAIVALVLRNPALISSCTGDLEDLHLSDPDAAAVLAELLRLDAEVIAPLPVTVAARLGRGPLERLLAPPYVTVVPAVRRPVSTEQAAASLTEEIAKLKARRGRSEEVDEAMGDISEVLERLGPAARAEDGLPRDSMKWRLHEASNEYERARRGQGEDQGSYEFAENGAPLDRDERASFRALLESLGFEKPADPE